MEAESIIDPAYFFRPYKHSDINFIHNSWGLSYFQGGGNYVLLTPQEFHEFHRPIRDKILNSPRVAIIVACAKEDPELIIGYSIVEKPKESNGLILHYVYTKQAFKREGIATELIKRSCVERPILYTHSTIIAGKIINKFKALGRKELERFLFCPHLT